MPAFEDHFSHASAEYAAWRPRYPAALFDFVASLAPARDCAWDVGTGSGQAAVELARRFQRVVATDASANQIASAQPHERIEYRVALAEESRLDDHTIDVVTVAQALHWFNLDRFAAEVRRVARPGAALVVWTYNVPRIDADTDALITTFHDVTVGPWWPRRRHDPVHAYANLQLPFVAIDTPQFDMSQQWTREQFLNYLRTWSAVKRYRDEHHADPVAAFEQVLANVWPDPRQQRTVRSPLTVKAWRIS